VPQSVFQLLGATSLLIGAKMNECNPLMKIRDLVRFGAESYSEEEVKNMESRVMEVLDFNLVVPSPLHFATELVAHFSRP
jgi:hypothetical protein